MATIRLALIPAKVLSDGSHKICIAIHHKEETKYIVTRFKVDSLWLSLKPAQSETLGDCVKILIFAS